VTHPCYESATWRKVQRRILKRDGWVCQIRLPGCLVTATQADHIVDVRAGGAWYDPANLRAPCGFCNRSREDQGRKGR
jgi:5-methylcytosine-specific restriction endonuclease McrA